MFTQAMKRDGLSFMDRIGKVLCCWLGHGWERVVKRTSRMEVPICPQPIMASVVPPLIFLSLLCLFVDGFNGFNVVFLWSSVSGSKRAANQKIWLGYPWYLAFHFSNIPTKLTRISKEKPRN